MSEKLPGQSLLTSPPTGGGAAESLAEARVRRAFWGSVGRTFRGEIWEDDAGVGLSQDSAQGNKPFDIDTCWYWAEVLRMANRSSTRMIVITAANQLGKSLVCELIARHKIKHEPGHMVLYDQTEESSADHMKTRFGPFLRSIPGIASQINEVLSADSNGRFNVTTQDIMLPGMILRGRPLNESNTQRITIRYMFVHDACLSERNGQLRRARIRLTQYLGQELLVVESQGGTILEGMPDDFTELVRETDDADLYVNCPHCAQEQIFTLEGWQRVRGEDFHATLPLAKIREIEGSVVKEFGGQAAVHSPQSTVHSLNGSGEMNSPATDSLRNPFSAVNHAIGFRIAFATQELTEVLKSAGRKMCGFRRGDELLAKLGEGLFNEKDIHAFTCYECFHCGSIWEDRPEARRALDHSSHYIPRNLDAGLGKYGFRIPAWICPRLAWGQIMLEKVQADNAALLGNDLPLQEWETKRAAATYDPKKHMARVASVTTTVNPKIKIPDELFRSGTVDCQKDKQLSALKGQDMTGHFWVTAWATDRRGNDVQLWRGYCISWTEWIAKFKELGIPTKNISVDASFKPDEVKAMAAQHAEVVEENGQKIYATWTMMRGSDQHSFRWEDGVSREYKIERPEEATIYHKVESGKLRVESGSGDLRSTAEDGAAQPVRPAEKVVARVLKINVITWSNFRVKNILHAQLSRMPGAPTMRVLPAESEMLSARTRVMEREENKSWDAQLNSEILGKVGKKTQWVEIHRENHYRDDCCMHIVRKIQAGVLGRMEIEQQGAQKAGEQTEGES